eukprot:TRINITY_DN3345_c1_g2_i2.p1 TRINITY_DN3345_c1_g2~~TRINITY_DN3345_c1_g2_i2.p1  ORF type:complete len:214 (-),score=9.24 TRINITY_DN3345_c1_g2_i2:21-662(-)
MTEIGDTKIFCEKYIKEDDIGKVFAYISLIPVILFVCLGSIVYYSRQIHLIFVLVGGLLTELITVVLKKTLKQPRPEYACNMYEICGSYGMPSSHTSTMFYFATVYSMMTILQLKSKIKKLSLKLMFSSPIPETIFIVVSAPLVGISRVYLGYHTVIQVLFGGVLGLVMGILWCGLMMRVVGSFNQNTKKNWYFDVLGLQDSSNGFNGNVKQE